MPTLDDVLIQIDSALATFTGAQLASASEVADELLDIRQLVTAIQRESLQE